MISIAQDTLPGFISAPRAAALTRRLRSETPLRGQPRTPFLPVVQDLRGYRQTVGRSGNAAPPLIYSRKGTDEHALSRCVSSLSAAPPKRGSPVRAVSQQIPRSDPRLPCPAWSCMPKITGVLKTALKAARILPLFDKERARHTARRPPKKQLLPAMRWQELPVCCEPFRIKSSYQERSRFTPRCGCRSGW